VLLDLGPDIKPRAAIGDKGYDSKANHALCRKRGIARSFRRSQTRKTSPNTFRRYSTRQGRASKSPSAGSSASSALPCAASSAGSAAPDGRARGCSIRQTAPRNAVSRSGAPELTSDDPHRRSDRAADGTCRSGRLQYFTRLHVALQISVWRSDSQQIRHEICEKSADRTAVSCREKTGDLLESAV
jgi:hypothetical protein